MKLAPIRMRPSFRHGVETPWGGDRLKTVFQKAIPDARTGESLECSVISGHNSTDENGTPLSELIERWGERLTGTGFDKPFPLLLKLIDAEDRLSVQVHPDDAYAARVENKQGKTEAWVILDCAEGAQLVYGFQEGVTREQLKQACEGGKALEALLRFVPVHRGDVFYIPSGTVHAIGAGIVLYEIQQSSDVTYRFYDWDRRDANGKGRELHQAKALDVVDLHMQGQAVRGSAMGDHIRLLDETYFTLDRYLAPAVIQPDKRMFRILTAIEPARLSFSEGEMDLKAGETVLLPADGYAVSIDGKDVLVAAPKVRT